MTEKRGRGRPRNPDGRKPRRPVDPRIATPKKTGRRPHQVTDSLRGMVRMSLLRNERLGDIAAALGIDPHTFRKHYSEEVRVAKFETGAALTKTAIMIALGGTGAADDWRNADAAHLRWVLSRFFGVVEQTAPQEHRHSGAIGNYDIDKLGKDALLKLRTILAPVAVAGPDRRSDSEAGGEGEA